MKLLIDFESTAVIISSTSTSSQSRESSLTAERGQGQRRAELDRCGHFCGPHSFYEANGLVADGAVDHHDLGIFSLDIVRSSHCESLVACLFNSLFARISFLGFLLLFFVFKAIFIIGASSNHHVIVHAV